MTLGVAEQMYDAIMTWDILGHFEVTKVSLAFFRQFDKKIKVGKYRKSSKEYKNMMDALRNWAEQTLLFVAEHIPEDYVLPMAMDRITAAPTGSAGTIHSLIGALTVYDAYKGLIPDSWYHGYSKGGCKSSHIESDTESQYRAGF